MHQTDRRIIDALCKNGRQSNVKIAQALGISESTVRKRIDALLSRGELKVVGVVDPAMVGYKTRALAFLKVELAQVEQALRALSEMPEVVSVYWVTGEYDLVIDVVFESDDSLVSFLTERLSRVPGMVDSSVAHVLRVQKSCCDWTLPAPSILVVDDDPDFVETTRMVLQSKGYTVYSASNGEQALDLMKAQPVDLVILDIMMDGIFDGWDASWRIRSNPQLHDVAILVVSSITATDYLGMFPTDDDNLIDNFLSKPVSPEHLLREVKRLLART